MEIKEVSILFAYVLGQPQNCLEVSISEVTEYLVVSKFSLLLHVLEKGDC